MLNRGQGAIECCFGSTAHPLVGQGATEYLVLLAVVLIVALVSVALLGFFPGMASDAQMAQSQMYWKSATPIAIVDSGARVLTSNGYTYPYLRLRNTGTYPIRINAIVGGDGLKATQTNVWACGGGAGTATNISELFYLAPGEEKYFSVARFFNTACEWNLISTTGASTGREVGGASSICQNSSASPGMLDYQSIGFEYVAYMDGQQITKRQIGKDLIVKCMEPMN